MGQIFRWRLSKKRIGLFVRFIGVPAVIALLLYLTLYLGFPSLLVAAIIAALGILLVFIGGYYYNWTWIGFGPYTYPN